MGALKMPSPSPEMSRVHATFFDQFAEVGRITQFRLLYVFDALIDSKGDSTFDYNSISQSNKSAFSPVVCGSSHLTTVVLYLTPLLSYLTADIENLNFRAGDIAVTVASSSTSDVLPLLHPLER